MQLQQAVNTVFVQLAESLAQISQQEYVQPCKNLFNNTIGQHVRHVIELFQCLEQGYDPGVVNYEKRKRDLSIETDKELASRLLLEIYSGLGRSNKQLILEATYDDQAAEPLSIGTNYHREVAYNLEHTIHHMALIRVGLAEVTSLSLPENFGVATSTMKYKQQCAQ